MNQLSTTTNPTKTTTKSISQQPNKIKFQSSKTKELKRKKNPDLASASTCGLHPSLHEQVLELVSLGKDPNPAQTHHPRPISTTQTHHHRPISAAQTQPPRFQSASPSPFRASTKNPKRRESTKRREWRVESTERKREGRERKNRCKWEERKKNKSYILGYGRRKEIVFLMDIKCIVAFQKWKAIVHFVFEIGI